MKAKWKIEDVEEFIKNQAGSGLTQRKFCEQHGIKYSTFQFWKGKRRKKIGETNGHFIKLSPVTNSSQLPNSHEIQYQIEMGSNTILVPTGFSIAEVKSLVELLKC